MLCSQVSAKKDPCISQQYVCAINNCKQTVVVCDPDQTGLNLLGNNVATAAPALERLGAQGPFDPGYHGSYAFSGCTGSAPRFYTKAEIRPRYHGPAIVAQLIPTPAAQKGLCVFN